MPTIGILVAFEYEILKRERKIEEGKGMLFSFLGYLVIPVFIRCGLGVDCF